MAKLINQPKLPHLIFSSKALAKIKCALNVKAVNYLEFMFLGDATKTIENGTTIFNFEDIHFAPQIIATSAVETNEELYPEWLNNNFKTVESRKKIRLHGHSHVNMATSPSGTDKAFFQQMLDDVRDFFIQLIFNKRGEMFVNIFDKEANLIYEKEDINMFVRIGDTLMGLLNLNAIFKTTPKFKLSEEHCTTHENLLFIGDKLIFDFDTLSFVYDDDNIVLQDNLIKVINEKELTEQLSEELDSAISHKHTATPTSFYPGGYTYKDNPYIIDYSYDNTVKEIEKLKETIKKPESKPKKKGSTKR